MTVEDILQERRENVLGRWGEAILATYPLDGARFFRSEKDPFNNPVGSTILKAIGPVYDWVLGRADEDSLASSLDAIVRVRAIQSFTPTQAIGFVFVLKRLIAEQLAATEAVGRGELMRLFERVDELALRAFDVFVACRERVAEVRVREALARTASLLRRAGAVDSVGDEMNETTRKEPPAKGGRTE
jgi:hypothetical protein